MLSATQRYLELAHAGRNEGWRYALSVTIVVFCWLVLGYAPYLLLLGAGLESDPLLDFVAINFSILMMLAGLVLAVKLVHRRPLLTLITPEPHIAWRRIAHGAVAWGVIAAAIVLLEHALYPGRYFSSFDPARFLVSAVLVLLLTPLQSAAEELLFRGYALQGLALLTPRPLLLALASSAIFTAPHLLNPEVHEHGVLAMGANYFAIGLLLASVTLRDGRLELAIGLHAANNVFLAIVANYEGSALATESLFTARELDPWYSLFALLAGGGIFHLWVWRRAPRDAQRGLH
jgi:membrane protease YdiL (CAAX protease family)